MCPTYVEHGAADVGIVGKDVLLEQDSDVYEPLDLGFGACRIAVAAFRGQIARDRLSSKIRVATKYPKITERYFNQRGVPVEIIKLYGSIELAPIVGLADRIVDLVETGNTLKAHGLVEIEVHRPVYGAFDCQPSQPQVETPGHRRVNEEASAGLRCLHNDPSRAGSAQQVRPPWRKEQSDAHMKIGGFH